MPKDHDEGQSMTSSKYQEPEKCLSPDQLARSNGKKIAESGWLELESR